MAFVLPLDEIKTCLEELESEVFRLFDEEYPQNPTSQLCAFLYLGIRAVSLMRGMAQAIRLGDPDAYYVLCRGTWESRQLQLEFRLKKSGPKVVKWFQKKDSSWNADHTGLDRWIQGLGGPTSGFGKELGSLAELAHPTVQAYTRSVVLALARKNHLPSIATIDKAITDAHCELSGMVMCEFSIMDAQRQDLIDVPVERANLARCERAFEAFQKSLG